MLSKFEHGDSNNGQLLRDIEEISKALYLNETPSGNARSKSAGRVRLSESKSIPSKGFVREDLLYKDKRSSPLLSVWNWKKPLRALTHIGDKKFHCRFYLHVHSVEGLHSNFDNLSLCVHWKRKNEAVHTSLSKVSGGVAEFEETLINQCCVYGSCGGGGSDHPVKYESKLFLLYPSVVEAPGLDIGKQWVDLTSFLPRTLEELEGGKSQGQWTTSFNLSGKAKGACLNVSFGFWVMRDKLPNSSSYSKFPELLNMVQNRTSMDNGFGLDPGNLNRLLGRVGSALPSTVNCGSDLLRQSLDVKVCREMLLRTGLELSNSISCLYQKLDEGDSCVSDESDLRELEKHKSKIDLDFVSAEDIESYDWDITEFTITEVGTEISENEHLKLDYTIDGSAIENINVGEISKDNYIYFNKEGVMVELDQKAELQGLTVESLDSACDIQISESNDLNHPPFESREFVEQDNRVDDKACFRTSRSFKRSLSFDDVAESVASDFLNMLGMDSDPESPRELLLRQFEKEALASGNFIFDFDANDEESQTGCSIATGVSCSNDYEESELALIIHDVEEENKRVSELLKRRKAKVLEDLETEALMQEWGLKEKDFQNSPRSCSGGFGSPIELFPQELRPLPPLEEGFGPYLKLKNGGFLSSMNPLLFRNAKNCGNLIVQVSNPVVLPPKMGYDVMEIIQNLASDGVENLYKQINELVPLEDITGKTIKQVASNAAPSLTTSRRKSILLHDPSSGHHNNLETDFLADGLPMEFVSLEDLTPSIVNKIEGLLLEGLKTQSRMSDKEPPLCVTPQFSSKDTNTSIDLLALSITVDEWLRLDAGNIGDEDHGNERLSKTLAAHCAAITDLQALGNKNCRLLGNSLTIFHSVQLRDPVRNYEPVGIPMLLLILVRREGEENAGFRISGVHVAGVNAFPPEKQLWGTVAQQQSGTRWLLANGVTRNAGKLKSIVRSSPLGAAKSRLDDDDTLWSVSSNVCELGVSWNDLEKLCTRNSDVIFPRRIKP